MPDLSVQDYARLLKGKFPAGKPADPTENMSAEDKAKWQAMNEEHGDKFKSADSDTPHIHASTSESSMSTPITSITSDLLASYRSLDVTAGDESDTDAKFEKGKPADPTKNMSPEDKAKWEKSKDEHKDQFKGAAQAPAVGDEVQLDNGTRGLVEEVNDAKRSAWVWTPAWSYSIPWRELTVVGKAHRNFKRLQASTSEGARERLSWGREASTDHGWLTPPKNQGQMVEISYASGEGGIYKQVFDRSDRTQDFFFADWDDVKGSFEPWNREPQVPNRAWKKVRNPRLAADPTSEGDRERLSWDRGASTDHEADHGWLTPPKNQGQMVEISYASGEGGIYKQVFDRSDRTQDFFFADWDDVKGSFEPWNREPQVPNRAWKKVRNPRLAAGGLYGYTKAVEQDVTASVRKFQRQATKVAAAAWGRDKQVVAFLTAHAKRANSGPARLLLAAMKGLGPKIASTTRIGLNEKQGQLYDALMLAADDRRARQGNNPSKALFTALEQVRLAHPETERADFRAVSSMVMADLAEEWADKTAYSPSSARLEQTKALIMKYAAKGRPFTFQDVYMDRSDPADLDLYHAFRALVAAGELKGPDPFRVPGNHDDWVYRKGAGPTPELAAKLAGRDEMSFSMVLRGADPTDRTQPWVRAAERFAGSAFEVSSYGWIDDIPLVVIKPRRMGKDEWLSWIAANLNNFVKAMKPWNPSMRESLAINRELTRALQQAKAEGKLASLPFPAPSKMASAYGMYGYKAKTAALGLSACSDIRQAAGHIAYNLHSRRLTKYARITAFLREHTKQARCGYSRLLLASYPDAPPKVATAAETYRSKVDKTASMPSSVDEWIAWE